MTDRQQYGPAATLVNKLDDAFKAIDAAPTEVRTKPLVQTARTALKDAIVGLGGNPGGSGPQGSTGHGGGGP